MNNESIIEKPSYALYKVNGIAVAAFFGSILAGGILMAKNYKNLGKPEEAKKVIIFSTIGLIALIAISIVIPDAWHIPNMAYTIPQLVIAQALANKYQATDIKNHENVGGKLASNWKAFGISLIVCLALILAVFIVVFAYELLK